MSANFWTRLDTGDSCIPDDADVRGLANVRQGRDWNSPRNAAAPATTGSRSTFSKIETAGIRHSSTVEPRKREVEGECAVFCFGVDSIAFRYGRVRRGAQSRTGRASALQS